MSTRLERFLGVIRRCKACGRKNRIPTRHLPDIGRCGECRAEIRPPGEPLDVDGAELDDIVAHSPVPVLVDFWAAWCGPCRAAAPEVAAVAARLAGRALVLKIDTEAHPEVAARFGLRGIPTFVVFRGGRPVHSSAGLARRDQMETWLTAA